MLALHQVLVVGEGSRGTLWIGRSFLTRARTLLPFDAGLWMVHGDEGEHQASTSGADDAVSMNAL